MSTHKTAKPLGLGIISKDRYVGRLSEKETEGLMWLRGENKRLYVSYCDAPKECLSLRVRRNLVDTTPHWDGKKLTMRIRIRANADVVQNNSHFDITDMLQNEKAEKELEKLVIKTVQQSVRTTQEKWGTDIFDFAEKVHRKYPKEWNAFMQKEWRRIYSEMVLDTSVSVNIARSGSATSPMKKKVGED
ncbi:Ger(x)C family spore germination C-terminal domain-containing protein [Paenibacillus thiaminolyticus]|uniref:Ger(x)C family spore germination C-terminal domain-containing protein n=1 Tax=Paenibacillus thiaminolyticus TaxID=49283 RepID=UPI00232E74C5|nr:Ger(x)C family spore germination C-terminal domain-containing protein [Paenibacillus thiaminolyticus]WCF08762.1 Ger(x)C family spore germination C-terminal domain-containing protein [Paenibacillus thiaminolyticus]